MRSSHVLDNFRKGDYEGLGQIIGRCVCLTQVTNNKICMWFTPLCLHLLLLFIMTKRIQKNNLIEIKIAVKIILNLAFLLFHSQNIC